MKFSSFPPISAEKFHNFGDELRKCGYILHTVKEVELGFVRRVALVKSQTLNASLLLKMYRSYPYLCLKTGSIQNITPLIKRKI